MKVTIECTQKISYRQTVEVTKEEYDILMHYESSEGYNRDLEMKVQSILQKRIDTWDVYDGGDFDDIWIESEEKEEQPQ